MGEAGTTKRNAYPYAAYGALAQRDCKVQTLALSLPFAKPSNWGWGALPEDSFRGAYRESELAAFLSLDHCANFGAKGVEGEGFRQHVHARLEKLASKRCVLGVSGYEKYF